MSEKILVDMYAGGLVFWTGSMQPLAELQNVAAGLGLPVAWYPIQPFKALELALGDLFRRSGVMVRPTKPVVVKGPTGEIFCPAFVTVAEGQNERANQYENLRCFWLNPETFDVWTTEDGSDVLAVEVEAKRYRGQVDANNVSVGIEKMVSAIGGYKLRNNARVYYLPQTRMDAWRLISQAFETLGMKFFVANCPADAETAAAVADNAAVELRTRYQAAIDSMTELDSRIADAATSDRKRETARRRRAELLAELETVKSEAAAIDASFRGLIGLSAEIGSEIETAVAMAVLTTSN